MRSDRPGGASPILAAARAHVVQGSLRNGVRWALWPDARDSVVTFQVWVRAGSAAEERGGTGLAHMLEHLMFRGTEAVPDGVFDERMESLGAQINAMTWVDYTCYTSTAPPEALAEIAALEADRFAGLALTEDVFQAERSVVANERRQVVESVPESKLAERLQHLAFHEGPYGHPTIGWAEDIAAYTRESVVSFFERWYAPDQLMVAVSGAVEPSSLADLLEGTFGGLSARGTAHRPPRNAFVGRGRHAMKVSVPTPHVLLGWRAPGRAEASWPEWALLEAVLGGGDASRWPLRLEVEESAVLDVGSHLFPHAMEQMLELDMTLRQGVAVDDALAMVDEEVERLATDGPTPEEVEAASRRLLVQDAAALASTSGRASRMGESWISFGDAGSDFGLVDEMRAVGAADVKRLAGELMEAERLVLVGEPAGEEQ